MTTAPQDHFRRLEQLYHQAACNQAIAPQLRVSHGRAEVGFEARAEYHHAAGAVHGSYYFKALDDAAYFAANSLVEDVLVLTVTFTVQFLRPVTAGRLVSVGRVVRPGRRLIFTESVLCDEAGAELARGSGVFVRSRVPIEPQEPAG